MDQEREKKKKKRKRLGRIQPKKIKNKEEKERN